MSEIENSLAYSYSTDNDSSPSSRVRLKAGLAKRAGIKTDMHDNAMGWGWGGGFRNTVEGWSDVDAVCTGGLRLVSSDS